MAESTLTMTFATIRRAIGLMLGWDIDPANWSVNQVTIGGDLIASGLRQFYHPPILPGERMAHDWRFVKALLTISTVAPYTTGTITVVAGVVTGSGTTFPTDSAYYELHVSGEIYTVASYSSGTSITLDDTSVAVAAGTTYSLVKPTYILGDDFGSLDGPLTFAAGTTIYPPVEIIGEGQLRTLRQRNITARRPEYACIRAQAHSATAGLRYEIEFLPSPDAIYKITGRYVKLYDTIDATNLYPSGGEPHAETIKASILAAAELYLNDQKGVHWERFMERLQASVSYDRRTGAAERIGYNGDNSDEREFGPRSDTYYLSYNGVIPR